MGLEKEIVDRIHSHFIDRKYSKDKIFRNENAPEYIEFEETPGQIVGFTFNIENRNLDIKISPNLRKNRFEPESGEEFEKKFKDYRDKLSSYLEFIQTREFLDAPSSAPLKEGMNIYRNYLLNRRFEVNGKGNMHFKASLRVIKGSKLDETTNGILYYLIKPLLKFYRDKS